MSFKDIIADLARPYALYSVSTATALAIGKIAFTAGSDLNAGAVFAGALLAGLAGLYWGKAWELRGVSAHSAEVEKVRAAASPPPAAALAPAPEADTAPPPERE